MSVSPGTTKSPRLFVRGVRKSFAGTLALGGVDLSLDAGEIHAVIGENGAGKSTLMNVLAGSIVADAGTLELDGAPYRPGTPRDARRAGVAMVYQERSLAPHLTVAENVVLGEEPTILGFVRRRAVRDAVERALAQLAGPGVPPLDPGARVATLSPAAQQLVEIARALARPALRVLILDEPTSTLASDDVERLFAVIRRLRDEGVAVLYISHFLEEAQRVADRYTVLRDGRTVGGGTMRRPDISVGGDDAASLQLGEIVGLMAGRRIDHLFPRSERAPGDVVLSAEHLAGRVRPLDATFALRRGEVVGIAGLVGAGRTELLRAIFGLDEVARGVVRVGVHVGAASPGRRLAQGVGLASEDRKGEGLALGMSIADNLTLSKLPSGRALLDGWLVSPRAQRSAAARWIARLDIRCRHASQRVGELSGGNQQKVAFARLLHHDADVLLLDEPTRGVDVASKVETYRLIDALALSGKAVLMVSSYLPELLGVCDRIAVMRRGVLGPARAVTELPEHALLAEATGGAA